MNTGYLTATALTKRYGGTVALHDLSLDVQPGEIRGLIGENGSGKSTAMKLISGEVKPDAGQVQANGHPLADGDPLDRQRAGVGVVMQEPRLCLHLTVAENLFLGRLGNPGSHARTSFGRVRWREVHERAADVLQQAQIAIDPRQRVADLSQDDQHMVEVARVLAQGSTVVGFDETTASLTQDCVDRLFRIMRELQQQQAAQIFISHRLPEIMEICDRVTVLRDGEMVGTVDTAGTTETELVEMMVGRSLTETYSRPSQPPGPPVLQLSDMRPEGQDGLFNLTVHEGEVVGLGGLVGSGRTEVLEAIYGLRRRTGSIHVAGRPIRAGDPRSAIAGGLGLVPEDRRGQGLAIELSVRDNASTVLDGSRGFFSKADESGRQRILQMMYQDLKLKAGHSGIAASTLSGGNQQKIVLGRWLAHQPKVLLLDEPTRGIDIGAKREIYELIHALASQGMAIVLVSSELPELIGLCDRIIMMREGTPTREFVRPVTEVELLAAVAS